MSRDYLNRKHKAPLRSVSRVGAARSGRANERSRLLASLSESEVEEIRYRFGGDATRGLAGIRRHREER